jgi:hypothetical protein
MKSITSILKYFSKYITIYQLIVGVGFIIAMVLMLVPPLQMPETDDWAYYNGVQNFSENKLTIDDATWSVEAEETREQGSVLVQYLRIGPNKWALEKAPGSVFYIVPFEKIGIPRWGNVLLALNMVIVVFILLKRLRDEKTAMIGSLLILFTPIAMVMGNRVYMDSYSSLAFLVVGGGLYLYYHLQRKILGAVKGGILLFLAFFYIGWAVVARYTNLPIAAMLLMHLVVMRLIDWRRGESTGLKNELIPLILGIGLPMATLFLYDYFVFGSVIKTGYAISPYPIRYAFQYWGKIDINGASVPTEIFLFNLEGAVRNLWTGFPLLIIGIPAFCVILYFKVFKRHGSAGKWSSLRREMPWDIWLVLISWFLIVLIMSLTYEWLAGLKEGGGFVLYNRFYLPWLLPVVIVCALVMTRFSYKVLAPVLVAILGFGILLYTQWVWDLRVLPGWMTSLNYSNYIYPSWWSKFYFQVQ